MVGLIILTSSCRTTKVSESISIKDTTITRISWRDTTIYIPTQVAELDGLRVFLDSLGKVQLPPTQVKSENAFVKVAIKDNILTASGGCDSIEIALKQRDIEIEHLREVLKEKTKTVEVKYIPSIYHFFKWWSILSLSLLVLYAIKPIRNLVL
jgi:hypothetical protein